MSYLKLCYRMVYVRWWFLSLFRRRCWKNYNVFQQHCLCELVLTCYPRLLLVRPSITIDLVLCTMLHSDSVYGNVMLAWLIPSYCQLFEYGRLISCFYNVFTLWCQRELHCRELYYVGDTWPLPRLPWHFIISSYLIFLQLKKKAKELQRAQARHLQLEQELAFYKLDKKFEPLDVC